MNEHKIDRYLLGQMSREELKSFKAQLTTDENLAQEVKQQRELLKDIEGYGRIELKSKLKEIHNSLYNNANTPATTKPKFNVKSLFFKISVAAAFIGVLSIGWLFMQQDVTNDQLFSQNFKPYEISLNQRSDGNGSLSKIENLYDNGQYEEVIPLIKSYLKETDSQSSQLLIGLGNSYLKTGQTTEAIAQFDKVIANKDFNFEDEARWYISLAYIKSNEEEKAKAHLSFLASDNTRDHHEKAQVLLTKLKKK